MRNLSEFEHIPEEYAVNALNKIPDNVIENSQMHPVERRFINGLIHLLRPKRILEVGVAEGGGTIVLLNAIESMKDATVASVDIANTVWRAPTKRVGDAVNDMYQGGNKQWVLYREKCFSEIADVFTEPFDFCVIDTGHVHPVESLDFLTVLPYLSDNAVVVFHDLATFVFNTEFEKFPRLCFANKLCFDTIVGVKLKPIHKEYLSDCMGFAQLGAVQISPDTHKYIRNVFDMLYFPWAYFDNIAPYIKSIAKIIKKHYPAALYDVFRNATIVNARMIANDFHYERPDRYNILPLSLSDSEKFVFYGAGFWCKMFLEWLKREGLPMPIEIWDVNAKNIESFHGIQVVEPPFASIATKYPETVILITIADEEIAEGVKSEILRHSPSARVIMCQGKDIMKRTKYNEVLSVI
ncbi:MAG: class I SAM-dependent methyltransferase [Prevotellaceae bacterium]|jgi:predicted O-methyltransferase YrrM|nr:class I SAM-dependent methyltransferase [Prevotellaceae bacterium]